MELVFISAQPSDLYFVWQVDVQLHNFRKYGYSDKAHVLVFLKKGEEINKSWGLLVKEYPETTFWFREDTEGIEKYITSFHYAPLLRPWLLRKYWQEHPELKDKAVFYHDSDIIFTKKLDFSPFLNDDINYLSYTGNEERSSNYLNYDYFLNKLNDVDPSKLKKFMEADPLGKFTSMFGITPHTLEENNQKTGGAQYLLKGVDSKFWADVFDGCLFLKTGMHNYNQHYFQGNTPLEKENKGFQAWCADMWSVLWNLWARGMKTECPKEFDFCWATDTIDKWDRTYIYHDAGKTEGTDLFNKKGPKVKLGDRQVVAYASNMSTPFEDDLSWVNPGFCSKNYVKEIQETRQGPYFNH